MVDKLNFKVPSMGEMRDIIELYKDTEPEIKRPLRFGEIPTIKKSSKSIKKYIERINTNYTDDDDIVVGGSGAAYTQVRGIRKPHDLDLHTKYMYKVKDDLIKILSRKYKNISSQAVLIKKDGSKVIQILIDDEPVIDIKSDVKVGTTLHIFDKEIYYDFKSQPPIKIQNIFYVRVNELLARKGQGINRFYYDKIAREEPVGHRVEKDVRDFYTIAKSLKRSARKKDISITTPKPKKVQKQQLFGTEGWF